MDMIMALKGHPATEWEGMAKDAWWGCLLGKGLFFCSSHHLSLTLSP